VSYYILRADSAAPFLSKPMLILKPRKKQIAIVTQYRVFTGEGRGGTFFVHSTYHNGSIESSSFVEYKARATRGDFAVVSPFTINFSSGLSEMTSHLGLSV